MNDKLGVETHPLADLFCIRSPFPADHLNDRRVRLTFIQKGEPVDEIFRMRAWVNPNLPEFTAVVANVFFPSETGGSGARLTFDADRLSKVRTVDAADYEFEGDLGVLQQLRQDPEVFEAVKRNFDEAQEKNS